MFFDFEDRHFETPGLESAMSWREQVLLSLFLHLAVLALAIFIPQLDFVRAAQERRAARLVELGEQEAQAMAQARAASDEPTFVFIAPRVEIEPREDPRPDAPLSDRDRVAQSPGAADDPTNPLPNADGNSSNFVINEDPQRGLNPDPDGRTADAEEIAPIDDPVADTEVAEVTAGAEGTSDEADGGDEGETELAEADRLESELAEAAGAGSLQMPGVADRERGAGTDDPDPIDPADDRQADGLLGRALQNLDRYALRESFMNRKGDTGRYGPEIQFDSRGAEFGPWIRRFIAQVRRNWFVPYAIMSRSLHGNVALTFFVNRDGSINELQVISPAALDAFTNSAFNALATSNPTQPLPDDYPGDRCFFTVTFYFNESPPV